MQPGEKSLHNSNLDQGGFFPPLSFDEGCLATMLDMAAITFWELDKAEERIQYLASHDEMTGLPNRSQFNQLLIHAIESSSRYRRKFAFMFIDLDRCKQINDSLGHEAGDELLKITAQRLKAGLRSSDAVARLGSDEFVVMLGGLDSREQVTRIARTLIANIIKPIRIMNHECRITASIGICMYPDNAADAKTLMKRADMAMYLAKEMGLIIAIGKWVIQQAVKQCQVWQEVDLDPVSVSVNLSPMQFLDNDLVPFIEKELLETGLPEIIIAASSSPSLTSPGAG